VGRGAPLDGGKCENSQGPVCSPPRAPTPGALAQAQTSFPSPPPSTNPTPPTTYHLPQLPLPRTGLSPRARPAPIVTYDAEDADPLEGLRITGLGDPCTYERPCTAPPERTILQACSALFASNDATKAGLRGEAAKVEAAKAAVAAAYQEACRAAAVGLFSACLNNILKKEAADIETAACRAAACTLVTTAFDNILAREAAAIEACRAAASGLVSTTLDNILGREALELDAVEVSEE
jgi:hypothetical protein